MSDYSPPPRTGYTRSGKSLKAVRRYYALKDAASKKKRAQEKRETNREEEDRLRREEQKVQNQSVSKKRRSPDDDFLSKRIANELRVQQEANEKRGRQLNSYLNASTDRSALPVIAVNPKEVGPVFMTKTDQNTVPKVKSSKSAKSVGDNGLYSNSTIPIAINSPSSMGCVFTVVVIAMVYVITYTIMAADSINAPERKSPDSTMKSMGWLAANSLIVLVASSFWLIEKKQLNQALICLMLFIMSTISLIVYIVYSIVIIKPDDLNYYTKSPNPLNFWLPFTFLIFHLITLVILVRQNWNLLPKQQNAMGSEERARMSEYMAPA